MAALIIIGVVASSVGNGGNKSNTQGATTVPSVPYKVGDTATTSGWQVTVYSAKDPWISGNGMDTPAAGNRYVQVDVQVVNTTSSQEPFSSIMAFKLFDSTNRAFTEALVSTQPGPPDGTVPAHAAQRGFVTFEVPTASKGLVFQVQGSLTAAGSRFAIP